MIRGDEYQRETANLRVNKADDVECFIRFGCNLRLADRVTVRVRPVHLDEKLTDSTTRIMSATLRDSNALCTELV